MKHFVKKIYIILLVLTIFFINFKALAKEAKIQYTSENISNYFLGVISANKHHNNEAFQHLKKVKSLKNVHPKFNIEFIRILVLLEKFDEAFSFSESVWSEDELLFEADLLLGINSFIQEDYKRAEKYFNRLNKISLTNLFHKDFIGNVMLAWNSTSQNNKEMTFKILDRIPAPYFHLKKTQDALLRCYFDDQKTQESFKELINDKDYNFSRYNFFFANYLLHENKLEEANTVIENSRKEHNSNLLLKQTNNYFLSKKSEKIKNFFNCKNKNDSLAEFFYIMANLYSNERDFNKSNFYLKISSFLNNKFKANNALLAENYYFLNKNELSKKTYKSLKEIGSSYSWYASKSISKILLTSRGKKYSIRNLEKAFNALSNPNFEKHYELANFYKDNEYYKESIKHYSLALEMIKKDHHLTHKILDRRGTSYERVGDWNNAEKDLKQSLEILPDQAHVLNYLAYTWVDKGINIDRALKMLKKATELKKNDGYIIDSLGWAYYAKKNYTKAEFFLRRAVELLPTDPIINDHYADALWMLNKNIQARYVWNYVLKLSDTQQELRDLIEKKLIFGITKKL